MVNFDKLVIDFKNSPPTHSLSEKVFVAKALLNFTLNLVSVLMYLSFSI